MGAVGAGQGSAAVAKSAIVSGDLSDCTIAVTGPLVQSDSADIIRAAGRPRGGRLPRPQNLRARNDRTQSAKNENEPPNVIDEGGLATHSEHGDWKARPLVP